MASTGLGRTGTWRCWAGGLAAAAAIGASAQSAPTILLGEPVEVRPGETATLTIQAVGGPDEKVQLFATAESPPKWLAQGAWSAGPTATPRLAIEISPPAGATPGVRELAVHATGSGGFTTQAVAVWRVLAPRCQGALEYDADGVCRQCPPNHVPNAAKTGCDACPPNTERGNGATQCVDCPAGQTSGAGASCRCGTAARLTDAGCVACPAHADSRRNALNCDACPPGQHRPPDADLCAPCPAAGCAAKPLPRRWTAAQAKPEITITASETELFEDDEAHDLTVTVAYSPAAPAGTVLQLAYACTSTAAWAEGGGCACPSCPRDYGAGGFGSVQADGLTTVTLEGWVDVRADDIDDDGEVLEITVRNTDGFDVTPAKITLREPDRPTILVDDPDSGDLRPSARCGGERLCLSERAGTVDVPIRIEHPPSDFTYRSCRLAVHQHRLNTATPYSSRNFNDYQLVGAERLGPDQSWRATVSLVLQDDGEVEGLEALTVRGKCDGSSDKEGKRHLRLGFQPKTFWIEDAPWPVLRVERPSGGYVTGPGIDCGSGTRADCEQAHPSTATLELTATADAHHRFVAWREDGLCSGFRSDPVCELTLNADGTALPKFEPSSHVLTVERPENGYVTAQDIDCGSGTRADCEERYPARESVRLTATADANYRLLNWTGVCSGATATCDVTMSEARTVGATFGPVQRRLLVSPPDGGRIAGDGIDCGGAGADCSESYDHDEEVVLTATADEGREFASWSANCAASASSPNVCTVTMDGMEVVGATFAVVRPTLTVTRPTNGYVTAKGIDCGSGSRATCTAAKDHGTTLVVRATADAGYEFESWSGCDSEWPKCQFTLEADLTVGVTFAVAKRTLTVTRPTDGYVTAPGIDCGAGTRDDCTERYTLGTSVTLTATETTGHDFEKWGGACSGTSATCALEMTEDRTATATFKPEKRTLSVTVTGTGTVTGTSDFTCSSGTCTQDYDYGASVTLTATESTGHDFEQWGGACSGTTTTCALEMTDARTATATFKPEKRTLSVTVTGTGTVAGTGDFTCSSGTCTQDYDYGTSVTLTATEATNHDFEKWGGSCSGTSETCTLEMTDARTATAKFNPEKRTLSVTVASKGTVAGTGDFTCSSGTCTKDYDHGASVTLTATEATGHDFEKWGGACTGTTTTCTLEMTANRAATATFKPEKRTLTVTRSDDGWVTGTGISCGAGRRDDCTESYDYGASVTLRAREDTGYDFDGWSGDCSGSSTTCTLEMTANRSATPDFEPESRRLRVTIDGNGEVTATGGRTCTTGPCRWYYDYDTSVRLRAWEDTGHDFEEWDGDCDGTSTTCWLDMTDDLSATAKFKPEKRRLTVTRPSNGYVIAPGINCGAGSDRTDCAEDYDYDTRVTLRATGADNYDFDEWGGNCARARSDRCHLTMDAARSASVKFKLKQRLLTVNPKPSNGHVTEGPSGSRKINCGSGTGRADCKEKYVHGTVVTLTAHPDDGYVVSWSGCTGTENTCKVTMNGAQGVAATFGPKLTLTVTPTTAGRVNRSPEGTSCGTGCWSYVEGSEVTLTAVPKTGYVVSWSGCDEATGNECEVTMNGAKAVAATFSPTLTVTKNEGGSVTSTPGIDCGSNCTETYSQGAMVTLTAVPDEGYDVSWEGCGRVPTEEICKVTMNAPKTVKVTFTRKEYTLRVKPRPSNGYVTEGTKIDCGSGSRADCEAIYKHGDKLTFTATGDTNFRRKSWNGCDNTGTSCEVEVDGPETISATFEPDCPSGCVLTKCSGEDVCKCNGSTCPSGFAQQKNCSTTQAKQCIGDNRDCATLIRGRSCTTRQHAFSNTAQEYCFYETRDGSWLQCKHKTKVCFATITEIGCLPSAIAIEGTDPGPGGASDGEWSELALGYILSDFECGETPNSCTVTIGDEVETTTTHGVVDKEDSLENWLWECHSDNGTVRECSLPKDGD